MPSVFAEATGARRRNVIEHRLRAEPLVPKGTARKSTFAKCECRSLRLLPSICAANDALRIAMATRQKPAEGQVSVRPIVGEAWHEGCSHWSRPTQDNWPCD